jgi:hypothetical protein
MEFLHERAKWNYNGYMKRKTEEKIYPGRFVV